MFGKKANKPKSRPSLSRGARTTIQQLLSRGEVDEALRDRKDLYSQLEKQRLVDRTGRPTKEAIARRGEFVPNGAPLSEEATALLRRHLGGDRQVTDENRVLYRELAMHGIVEAGHSFSRGDEAIYRLTEQGFKKYKQEMAEQKCQQ